MIRRMANIDRVAHQPQAGDARRPLEPDSHPRCHVRQSPPLPGTYEPFRRRHRLQYPSRPMDAPGGRRLTVEARDHLTHKQKVIYSLTEPALQLVPLLAVMGARGGGDTHRFPMSCQFAQSFSKGVANPCGKHSWRNCAARTLVRRHPDVRSLPNFKPFDGAVRRRSASPN